MPIYEYDCNKCDTSFEKLVPSFSTPDSEVECPECGESGVSRKLSFKSAFAMSSPVSGGCNAAPGSGFT